MDKKTFELMLGRKVNMLEFITAKQIHDIIFPQIRIPMGQFVDAWKIINGTHPAVRDVVFALNGAAVAARACGEETMTLKQEAHNKVLELNAVIEQMDETIKQLAAMFAEAKAAHKAMEAELDAMRRRLFFSSPSSETDSPKH